MPTERVVEVVPGSYRQGLNPKAAPSAPMHEKFTASAKVSPSSLAAAMLTLAEAVDEKEAALHYRGEFWIDRLHNAICAYETALAAVRAHPDYKRPE